MIPGKNQRQQHQSPKQSFAGEMRSIQRKRSRNSESERDPHRTRRYKQTIAYRFPDRCHPQTACDTNQA